MDCRVPQSCSLVMERPGPSSPDILSPENFSPVSGKVLDGRDGLLGCLVQQWRYVLYVLIHFEALLPATIQDTCEFNSRDSETTPTTNSTRTFYLTNAFLHPILQFGQRGKHQLKSTKILTFLDNCT